MNSIQVSEEQEVWNIMECYQMNFNKFLINKNGSAVLRFAPTAAPSSLEKYIVDELNI